MIKRVAALLIAMTLLAAFGAGCKKKKPPKLDGDGDGEAKALTPYKSTGNEGSVAGTISFEGATPKAEPLDPSNDAFCNSSMTVKEFDYYKIKDGKVQEVLVYLKGNNIENYSFAAPADPAVLDQRGCRYSPRVIAMVAGQKLAVKNSDSTSHNVHPQPKNNTGFNKSQAAGEPDIIRTFDKPEERIPVKCDQHPWMKAWISVMNHPFFAVTDAEGKYNIAGVPPGSYTLVVWHEKLGVQNIPVSVTASGTVTKDVTLKGGSTGGAAVQVSPPLVLPYLQ
jgi:plastocyanin